jgi:hypothetical protein
VQPINYVNTLGLHWALLTNGKFWKFLDNRKSGEAVRKVAFELELKDLASGERLASLLQPSLWEREDAFQEVSIKIQLVQIIEHLKYVLHQGYALNAAGVRLALKHECSQEVHELALRNLNLICDSLFPSSTSPILESTLPEVVAEKMPSAWEIFVRELNLLGYKKTGFSKISYTVTYQGIPVTSRTIRELYAAWAETCLKMSCSKGIELLKLVPDEQRNLVVYPTSYFKCSNGLYVLIWFSFDNCIRRLKPILQALGFPEGSITISSNETVRQLP